MGRIHTQDPSDVSDGLQKLDESSARGHTHPQNDLHNCEQCGALLVVKDGHTALDDDTELTCHDCDKPLGVKIYEAFTWRQ